MRRAEAGFTLVELLIAIILMLMILGAAVYVFNQTVDVTTIGERRIQVYDQARKALDRLQSDLLGCIDFNSQRQRFILQNGYSENPGDPIQMNEDNNYRSHVGGTVGGKKRAGADTLICRSIAEAGDTIQQVEVTYRLFTDPTRLRTRTGRPLFVLKRKTAAPNNAQAYVDIPQDTSGNPIYTASEFSDGGEELVHFVTSFNIEYFASNGHFSQLDQISGNPGSPCPLTDPLGDGNGSNDTGSSAVRIPYVRITLTIVDDIGEKQERTFSRVMWIPTGS